MSEEILKEMKEIIAQGKMQMEASRVLIDKLRTAGENVTSLEKLYRVTKARLNRYEKAFGT